MEYNIKNEKDYEIVFDETENSIVLSDSDVGSSLHSVGSDLGSVCSDVCSVDSVCSDLGSVDSVCSDLGGVDNDLSGKGKKIAKKNIKNKKIKNEDNTIIKKNKKNKIIVEKKRPPGRPRSNPKKNTIPKNGIIDKPTDECNAVEFIYDTPTELKKIINMFKSLASLQIQILFRPTDIIFYAKGHHGKNQIYVKIDCSKSNSYYCNGIYDIGIPQADFKQVLDKINKIYEDITIVLTHKNINNNMIIIFQNELKISEIHTIKQTGEYNKMNNEVDFIDESYLIQFTWPSIYFKKTIHEIKQMSKELSIIQNNPNDSLEVEYISRNKKIISQHVAKEKSKIKLISKLQEGDSFHITICAEYIQPISNSHAAKHVQILIDENKKFMTKSYVGNNNIIEIKTLTDIVDNRYNNDSDTD
jgi:hypothetical protein